MFPTKIILAFIISVFANTVVAQSKQGDFDLLCEGTGTYILTEEETTTRFSFSDVWTISPSQSQVSNKLSFGDLVDWYPANIMANTIEWHRENQGKFLKFFHSYQIDRRSQVFKGNVTVWAHDGGLLTQRNYIGKCSPLGSPKF